MKHLNRTKSIALLALICLMQIASAAQAPAQQYWYQRAWKSLSSLWSKEPREDATTARGLHRSTASQTPAQNITIEDTGYTYAQDIAAFITRIANDPQNTTIMINLKQELLAMINLKQELLAWNNKSGAKPLILMIDKDNRITNLYTTPTYDVHSLLATYRPYVLLIFSNLKPNEYGTACTVRIYTQDDTQPTLYRESGNDEIYLATLLNPLPQKYTRGDATLMGQLISSLRSPTTLYAQIQSEIPNNALEDFTNWLKTPQQNKGFAQDYGDQYAILRMNNQVYAGDAITELNKLTCPSGQYIKYTISHADIPMLYRVTVTQNGKNPETKYYLKDVLLEYIDTIIRSNPPQGE